MQCIRILMIVIITVLILIIMESLVHSSFIFTDYILYFLFGLFIPLVLWALYKDLTKYKLYCQKHYLSSSIVSLISITMLSCLYIYKVRLDSSPILFRAITMVDFNADSFDFREDSSYLFTRWTFLGADYYRGRYEIKDSLIRLLDSEDILSNSDVKLVLKTDLFLMQNDSLYQINTNHQFIANSESYKVLK